MASVEVMKSRLLSGSPAEMAKVLDMTRRDKRFDVAIRRCIDMGVPMSESEAANIARRYSERLIQLRAETDARLA